MHLALQVAWQSGRRHLFGQVCQEKSSAVSCLRPCRFASYSLVFVMSKILGSVWLWLFGFFLVFFFLQ